MKEIEVTISWENDNFFEIKEKEDGGDTIVIGRFEENGELEVMWNSIQKTMLLYFKTVLERIGEEMKV